MYDLNWQTSGYTLEQMQFIVDKSDYLIARSFSHIGPIEHFFGRTPNRVIEDFNLERLKNDY